MLKQALLLFLVTFEVYMVEIPEDYFGRWMDLFCDRATPTILPVLLEAVSLLRLVVFGNVYENEVPESIEAQGLMAMIEGSLKTTNWSLII